MAQQGPYEPKLPNRLQPLAVGSGEPAQYMIQPLAVGHVTRVACDWQVLLR